MQTRVISAIVAIVLMSGLYLYFGTPGLLGMCTVAAIVANCEYVRLAFRRFETPRHIEVCFSILTAGVFFVTVFRSPAIALMCSALAAVILIAMILLTIKRAEELSDALQIQALAMMGLFYCGIFTGLTTKTLLFDHGQVWFFGLLAIVFSGDTFAYFAGRAFGKKKLLEPVSPKKTIEGSIGGLVGSAIAGGVMGWLFFRDIPFFAVVTMALITGGFAQVGDLYESLLKRVADVKDSGRLMPGHGGVLDRLDGVLFAAPVYFALVTFLLSF